MGEMAIRRMGNKSNQRIDKREGKGEKGKEMRVKENNIHLTNTEIYGRKDFKL